MTYERACRPPGSEMHIVITKDSHPILFDCFDVISHDSGAGCHDNYSVPESAATRVEECESELAAAMLAGLEAEQLTDICIGEESDQHKYVAQYGLQKTHALLTDFFNDFEAE